VRLLIDSRGPADHGVVRHAATLASRLRAGGHVVVASGRADVSHAQFTDSLWGAGVAAAAAAYVAWAATAARPLVVTLHDVPGADPDPDRDARRAAGYARVAAASEALVVSSDHEAAKVRRFSPGRRVEVVELPLSDLPAPSGPPWWGDRPTLGVLGFVYPGKGHDQVITAASRQQPRPTVVALGAVSPGHEDLRVALREMAGALGVDLVVTGRLSGPELSAGLAAVTVPVAAGAMVSASASLLTWLAGARRPVTAAGAYANEVDGRHPGLLELYHDPAERDRLVARALESPELTRLGHRPAWPDTGAGHTEVYRRVLAR
jgi:glycosyltransferase involved in cell wall biosynthesis